MVDTYVLYGVFIRHGTFPPLPFLRRHFAHGRASDELDAFLAGSASRVGSGNRNRETRRCLRTIVLASLEKRNALWFKTA